jgi:hypothetical protein
MGKLKDLAAVNTAKGDSFVYTPPAAAFEALRILVKPDIRYVQGLSTSVSTAVLGAVLRGLRRANPHARIVLVERYADDVDVAQHFDSLGLAELLDAEMRAASADALNTDDFINEYDCCISISGFTPTPQGVYATLENLSSMIKPAPIAPSNEVLQDVYFTLGHYFHGAVVDFSQSDDIGQVVWGDDLLAVDEVACQLAGQPIAEYIAPIRQLRKTLA